MIVANADFIDGFALWVDEQRGAERISGFSAGEMFGLSIAEWGALSGEGDELTGQLSPLVERALAGEVVRYEARRRRKDGTVIDLQATLTPWRSDGEVVGVTSTASDITERNAAERELDRLAQAAEYGSDVVASYDLDGRICHWNAGAEAVFGFSAQEMIGRSWADLNALTGDSEDGDRRVSGAFARALAGEVVRYEARRKHKGAELDLQVTLMPWRVDGADRGRDLDGAGHHRAQGGRARTGPSRAGRRTLRRCRSFARSGLADSPLQPGRRANLRGRRAGSGRLEHPRVQCLDRRRWRADRRHRRVRAASAGRGSDLVCADLLSRLRFSW